MNILKNSKEEVGAFRILESDGGYYLNFIVIDGKIIIFSELS